MSLNKIKKTDRNIREVTDY